MGITFSLMEKLRARNVLAGTRLRVLDIGSSNLYQADAAQIIAFVKSFPQANTGPDLPAFAERLAKGSGYDPVKGGLNEAFAGELIERCGMQYLSFDIAKGYKTEVFDLNLQDLPDYHGNTWDVVLNIGTTEHVLNQYNSFKVIHEATKPGGFIVHQLPVAGFTNHGYYLYTGRMFSELASFNKYEIVDLYYDGPAGNDDVFAWTRAFQSYYPALKRVDTGTPVLVPNVALTIIYRKTIDCPFVGALETSTSVGAIPASVTASYGTTLASKAAAIIKNSQVARNFPLLRGIWHRLRGL